jgi:hypothetical protein
MYADVSHLNMELHTGHTKTKMVLSDDVTDRDEHGRVKSMQPCVSHFKLLCAKDLELRCGLVQRLDHDPVLVEDVPDLPTKCITLLHEDIKFVNAFGTYSYESHV